MTIKRTNSSDADFQSLVKLLDADLAIRDGDDHEFYHQFNSISRLHNCVVAYLENNEVGCGAFKPFSEEAVEIKRMYTLPETRGKGVASKILNELETWAREEGYRQCLLETGIMQPEAIALYEKLGYHRIPNYGQYIGVENSVCYLKIL